MKFKNEKEKNKQIHKKRKEKRHKKVQKYKDASNPETYMCLYVSA